MNRKVRMLWILPVLGLAVLANADVITIGDDVLSDSVTSWGQVSASSLVLDTEDKLAGVGSISVAGTAASDTSYFRAYRTIDESLGITAGNIESVSVKLLMESEKTGNAWFKPELIFTDSLDTDYSATSGGPNSGGAYTIAMPWSSTWSTQSDPLYFLGGSSPLMTLSGIPDDAVLTQIRVYFKYMALAGQDYNVHLDDLQITYVPEPATLSLIGLGGLVGLLRRRK